MQLAGFSNSFASGEIAPDAWERSDLAQHQTGCEEALNMLGLTTGPGVSRGGFWRRGEPKLANQARRLFKWLRADGEALVLEVGHFYLRVWTARGAQIETTPGSGIPFEQPMPYAEADLAALRIKQVGDVGYITSAAGVLNTVLRRLADNLWQVEPYKLVNGPYLTENQDPTRTLTLNTLGGGSWQVLSSYSKFTPDHVGSLIRVRPPGGGPGLRTWGPSTAAAAADQIISVGRIYSTAAGGTTGNTPPTHEAGTVSDGGVDWTFLHDGQASLRVTAYVSDTEVTAQEESTLPTSSGVPTPNWSDQSLSLVHGFPTALSAVREERLAFAGSRERPDTIEFSRTAGFTAYEADFKPGLGTGLVVEDDAVRVQVGDNRARIVWMLDGLPLIAGSTEAEWIVAGETIDDPITPEGVKARRISAYGSADVIPVVVQGPPALVLHIARGGTTLRELQLGGGGERDVLGRDLSILAQHVFGLGVVEMDWSRPDNNLWLRLADGTLACLTYHYEHGILGVRRQPLPAGFLAEGLATAPGPEGRDRLHVAAVRSKDGSPQRAHFVLAERSEGMFVDCAAEYQGAPVTIVAGLGHLEGETVRIVADDAEVPAMVVAGGQIELPTPASDVVVGLPLLRRFKSLPFDPDRSGTPVAKKSRPGEVYVVLGCVEAIVRAEPQDEPDERVIPSEEVIQRRPGDLTPVVRRKRAKVFLGAGADRDVRVVVETEAPFDLAVYALRPVYESQ